jgi:hypothetical protein
VRARPALSAVAAALVAVATLLPGDPSRQVSALLGHQVGDDLHDALTLIIIGLSGLAVIGVVWRSQLARRLNMSWPLFLIGVLYLLGFVALVSATARSAFVGLVSIGTGGWIRQLTDRLDVEHVVTYAAFMVLVSLAWRERIALWWLALGVFAYGYVLELLQQLVPGRQYGWDDLAANAFGIVLGVLGILLFDVLADAREAAPVEVPEGHRRRRSGRSSRSARRSKLAGLVTALAGLLIILASVLAGSMAEFRLAEVAWQIFTQFSALYAFTFWVGVLVMVVGGVMLRGPFGGRARPVRSSSPR